MMKKNLHTGLSLMILVTVLFASQTAVAQSKEIIIGKGISLKASYEQDIENGDREKKINKVETFDKKGEVIDLKVYDSKGEYAKDWFQYKYDEKGKLIEEIEYDSKKELKKRTSFKYDANGQLIEEVEYNPGGKLKKRTLHKYSNGLKISKEVFDEKERLSSKTTYEYQYSK